MAEGYGAPEQLADTAWLEERLGDAELRIVDTDVVSAYHRGHIPGAVMVPDNYQKDPDTGRVLILPPEKFARMMEDLGIGDDMLVVTYDNSRSLYAGRLWWKLNNCEATPVCTSQAPLYDKSILVGSIPEWLI